MPDENFLFSLSCCISSAEINQTFWMELNMKKIAVLIMLALSSSAFSQSTKANFDGFFGGLQVGRNSSDASGRLEASSSSIYPGLVVGYNSLHGDFVVGVEVFADYHNKSTTYDDGGLGLKLGKVFNNTMIYVRVGTTGSWPSYRPQIGLGAEYKLSNKISLTGFAAHDTTTDGGIKRSNNNAAVGLNYYFN